MKFKNNFLSLVPTYWASVSGGKDSLYMLKLILSNLDKYPLNGVVHFELEIDYPFIKNVIDYMETECKKFNIPFVRIKPSITWEELYNKYHFPNRIVRWCNSKYKLDAKKQLVNFMKKQGYNTYFYIGYCKDEVIRYSKRSILTERYPLVEENIYEVDILNWAKTVPIFNDYYKFNTRCGCMYCPLASYKSLAYLYKYYPENYKFLYSKWKDTEEYFTKLHNKKFNIRGNNVSADYLDFIIKNKYVKLLDYYQLSFL